jgi:phospho-N-acetylmuramoyl-pentapeptide-transferase
VIIWLFRFLTHSFGVKIPAVFYYASTRMLLAALTTLFCTLFFGPRVIKKLYELRTGQSIRVEDCPMLADLHEKKKDTPSMGGILILSSMVIALFLWMDLKSPFTLILLATTLYLGVLGGYDDYLKMKRKNSKGLNGKKKFLLQLLFGLLLGVFLLNSSLFPPPENYIGRYYVPFLKDPLFILSGAALLFGLLITIFFVTGFSNAVNLTDGLDGLASGCLILTALVLACVAFLSNNREISRYLNILYIEGSGEIGIYLCALMGACLGFLWYNGYPAQVFMGDVGSIALGGIIGTAAILLRRECLLIVCGGIFVVETLSVILQVSSYKWRNKKRIFLCTPLHHHFEYKGWPETKIVLRFWIINLILAIIALISLKFQ